MAPIDWNKVEEILGPIIAIRGIFLVGHTDRRERGRRVLQMFVDTDEGITIAQCAEVSRELAAKLDASDIISEPYELEVSSPGIDRPIVVLRQYRKNVGRKFAVRYWEGTETRAFRGTLTAVEGSHLTFVSEDGVSATLEFPRIIESMEILPW